MRGVEAKPIQLPNPLSGRLPDQSTARKFGQGVSIMSDIRREDLLVCLRKLQQERHRSWVEGDKHDIHSTVAHGYFGVADGIEFAVGEIAARFGIDAEEIEEEQSAEAKPEKKMAPSKGKETRGGQRKSS
jgi:hypothetical protein